jgi:sugar/nucleoside kinase (ribokinase family)
MANVSVSVKPVDKDIFFVDVTLIDPVEVSTGGDALNVSITAARLGNKVALVSKVGDDLFGRIVLDEAKNAGVFTDSVRVSRDISTATAVMLVDEHGDRNICAYRGAFETMGLEDMDLSMCEDARIVDIGSIFALKKLDGDGIRTILQQAKSAMAITAADIKFDTYGLGFEGIRQVFPYLDYFLPSYEEAKYLTKECDPARQCKVLMDAGCGNVIVKIGDEGCYLATSQIQKIIPPCPARRVDTSGAGDNFVAGFLTGINMDWGPEKSARFGNATAAVSIQEMGANGAVRCFDQIMDHIHDSGYSL